MLSQTTAITGINLKSIPERWTSSLVIVVGLAGVVAVFTALLAMAVGFQSTLQATGRSDAALVMRGGSQTELNSVLVGDAPDVIRQAPGIARDAQDRPLVSGELGVITELFKPGETGDTTGSNITLRGVEPNAFTLRPQLKVVEGRRFNSGLRELIVGRGVAGQYQGVEVGKTLRMRGSDWTVVGVFESGNAHDSELWADVKVVQTTFGRGNSVSSMLAVLDGPQGLKTLQDHLKADPRVNVEVQREQDYYSGQSKQFRQTIGVLAGVVTAIMALGAMFAALNTMYAAVAARTREIATLRAIGFGGMPVLASVMVESLLLALLGGILGALIAYVLFNNLSVSTLSQNFTQVVFAFKVTPGLVLAGLVIALVIGMLGGLLPAWRAARLPVTTALRAA